MKTISITTKQGDTGYTSTLSGEKVNKHDLRIEINGLIDELIVSITQIKLSPNISQKHKELMTWIQHCLFVISAHVSDLLEKYTLPQITNKEMNCLDKITEHYEHNTNMPEKFILSATTLESYHYEHARVITRKLEREFSKIPEFCPEHHITKETFAYLNRLSDLFFILARNVENNQYEVVDYNFITEFVQNFTENL